MPAAEFDRLVIGAAICAAIAWSRSRTVGRHGTPHSDGRTADMLSG